MRSAPFCLCTLFVAAGVSPASALCRQDMALYHTPGARTELAFRPAEGGQQIEIRLGALETIGTLRREGALEQPILTVPHGCDRDATDPGDPEERCILYRSVVYSLSPGETLTTLPEGDDEAAVQLVLPNFSETLFGNPALSDMEASMEPAGDIYTFAGCQDE